MGFSCFSQDEAPGQIADGPLIAAVMLRDVKEV